MTHVFRILLVVVIAVAAAAGQEPQQPVPAPDASQSEQQQIEDEFVRSREQNGESHASGARPDLGPVVLGNPTDCGRGAASRAEREHVHAGRHAGYGVRVAPPYVRRADQYRRRCEGDRQVDRQGNGRDDGRVR